MAHTGPDSKRYFWPVPSGREALPKREEAAPAVLY